MATDISNMGHTSIRVTVNCTKAVFEFLTGHTSLSFQENYPNQNNSQYFRYRIMADESTQDEKKLLIICYFILKFY